MDPASERGSEAQSTATKGAAARGLLSWMARANSSLPTPVSPVTNAAASLPAASATTSRQRRMAALTPTMECFRRDEGRWAGSRAR